MKGFLVSGNPLFTECKHSAPSSRYPYLSTVAYDKIDPFINHFDQFLQFQSWDFSYFSHRNSVFGLKKGIGGSRVKKTSWSYIKVFFVTNSAQYVTGKSKEERGGFCRRRVRPGGSDVFSKSDHRILLILHNYIFGLSL